MENNIENWYNKKTKLCKLTDLTKVKKHIESFNDDIVTTVDFSSDYSFKFYDIDKIDHKKILVRPENIFKLNFHIIGKQLKKYFTNVVIDVHFEVSGENDKSIKKASCTYKHDVYIKIINPDENYYDIGLEYFESVHDRIKDDDKEVSSKVNLDAYHFYEEKYSGYKNFMKTTIHSIMMCICALENDAYSLSKINFFKNYKQVRTLKADTEIFNQIISWKKNKNVEFDKLFESLLAINPNTNKPFEFQEFVNYLEENHGIQIEFESDTKNCNYKYFIDMINNVDSNISQKILMYRKIYTRSMDVLIDSQKEIIEYIKNVNETKKLVPKYIDNFLRLHIANYKQKDTVEKAYHLLDNKLSK